MRFGLFGGAKAPRKGASADSHDYEGFIDYVTRADELGYAGVFLVEHHFTGYGQLSASLNFLSYLAARTEEIRLGTAVVVLPWHNPILLAEQVATLDLLSGGRVDLGVGKGYRQAEFSGFGIPIEEATERFDEALEVIRKAWTNDKRFSHNGTRWRFDDIVVEPSPIQQPHPPLWMGAGSEQSVRRAAREGYNLLLDQVGSIEVTVERVAWFRDECERAGRSYDPMMVGVTRGLHLAKTEEERERAVNQRIEVLKAVGGIAKGRQASRYADPERVSRELVEDDDAPLLGSAAEIINRLEQLRQGGVGYVLMAEPDARIETLEAFAEEIMPAFEQKISTAYA